MALVIVPGWMVLDGFSQVTTTHTGPVTHNQVTADTAGHPIYTIEVTSPQGVIHTCPIKTGTQYAAMVKVGQGSCSYTTLKNPSVLLVLTLVGCGFIAIFLNIWLGKFIGISSVLGPTAQKSSLSTPGRFLCKYPFEYKQNRTSMCTTITYHVGSQRIDVETDARGPAHLVEQYASRLSFFVTPRGVSQAIADSFFH